MVLKERHGIMTYKQLVDTKRQTIRDQALLPECLFAGVDMAKVDMTDREEVVTKLVSAKKRPSITKRVNPDFKLKNQILADAEQRMRDNLNKRKSIALNQKLTLADRRLSIIKPLTAAPSPTRLL